MLEHFDRREGYYLAIVLFLAGFVGSALLTYHSIRRMYAWDESLVRMTAPGDHDLTLTEPGRYTVFYEPEGVLEGRRYSTGDDVPAFTLRLIRKDTAALITLTASGAGDSSKGSAVMDFIITQPGEYHLTANFPEHDDKFLLAVGRDANYNALLVYGGFAGSVLLFLAASVIAGALALWVYLRRPKEVVET
jgi:hypothetical protein